tara:strand:- start:993 stop:1475 length:483 start_codon:yes stop_codon:yes gene_type:complete
MKKQPKTVNIFNYYLNKINNNKLLAGIFVLLLNVGSKYVELGLSKTQEQALRNALGRELLIFSIVFTSTRDIILSILLTAAFMILSNHLFNEKSKYCLMPKKFDRIRKLMDVNNDNFVSEEEEKKAIVILEKAKEQKKKMAQREFINYMDNHKYEGSYSY